MRSPCDDRVFADPFQGLPGGKLVIDAGAASNASSVESKFSMGTFICVGWPCRSRETRCGPGRSETRQILVGWIRGGRELNERILHEVSAKSGPTDRKRWPPATPVRVWQGTRCDSPRRRGSTDRQKAPCRKRACKAVR